MSLSEDNNLGDIVTVLAGAFTGNYVLQASYESTVMSEIEFEIIDSDMNPLTGEGKGSWIDGVNHNNFEFYNGDAPFSGLPQDKPYDAWPGEKNGSVNVAIFFVEYEDASLDQRLPHPRPDFGPVQPFESKRSELVEMLGQGMAINWPHGHSDNGNAIDYDVEGFWKEVSAGNISINPIIYPHRIKINATRLEIFDYKPTIPGFAGKWHKNLIQPTVNEYYNMVDSTGHYIDLSKVDAIALLSPTNFIAPAPQTVECQNRKEGDPASTTPEICDGIDNDCDGKIDINDDDLQSSILDADDNPVCSNDDPVCGNGIVEGDEECDDGINNHPYNWCEYECRKANIHSGWATKRQLEVIVQDSLGSPIKRSLPGIKVPIDMDRIENKIKWKPRVDWQTGQLLNGGKSHTPFFVWAHEMIHVISSRAGDVYAQGGFANAIGKQDLLGSGTKYPSNMALPLRYALGWVSGEQIKVIDFRTAQQDVYQTVRVYNSSRVNDGYHECYGDSPSGKLENCPNAMLPFMGFELRLAHGWSYFWEARMGYENGQVDRVADTWPQHVPSYPGWTQENLPSGRNNQVALWGTDLWMLRGSQPQHRRYLSKVPAGVDGSSGALLSDKGDYWTVPSPLGLGRISVETAEFGQDAFGYYYVDVNIAYIHDSNSTGLDGNLYIRPWPDGEERWKSPDISIFHAGSDPKMAGLSPNEISNLGSEELEGFENNQSTIKSKSVHRIDATIHNESPFPRKDVNVNFFLKNFNAGEDFPKTFIGQALIDVPPMVNGVPGENIANINWTAPELDEETHFCIMVEIEPPKEGGETSLDDNTAQSNVVKIYSTSASPALKVSKEIAVRNPLDVDVRININALQSNEKFRTYISRTWFDLPPYGESTFEVESEYSEDLESCLQVNENCKEVNVLNISSTLTPLDDTDAEPRPLEGVTILVANGMRTEFINLSIEGNEIFHGKLIQVSDSSPLINKSVLIEFDTALGPNHVFVETSATGEFSVPVPLQYNWARAHYLGNRHLAPEISEQVFSSVN